MVQRLKTKQKALRRRKRQSGEKKATLALKPQDAGQDRQKKAASTTKPRPAAMAIINKPNSKDEFYTDEGCWILEVWRDDTVTVARARVAPGVTTKAHSLRGVVERYLMIEGKGIVRIGGKAPEEVGPGDVVIIPPHVSQSITNHGSGDLVFYCICTPPFTQSCYKSLE